MKFRDMLAETNHLFSQNAGTQNVAWPGGRLEC